MTEKQIAQHHRAIAILEGSMSLSRRVRFNLEHTTSLPRSVRVGINAVIVGLWLWLYHPVLGYLVAIFSREGFRDNQLVLIGVIVLIAVRVCKERLCPQPDAAPQLFIPSLILILGGSLLYLAVERFLDINIISAILFGLASYGLLGLWMEPQQWRQGVPAALLLIGTLPFKVHVQTFIGYPMRTLTATLVRDGLAAVGFTSVGVDTILILENGLSQVDLPCSGVKSLWAGLLFLLAATWIERRSLNLRWLLTAFIFAGLLFAANLARVGVLVFVGEVAGWRLTADMLHVPLGVLGFAAASAAAIGLLRLQWPITEAAGDKEPGVHPVCPVWLAPGLALVTLAMALAYTPHPHVGLSQPPPAWEFPDELTTEPLQLTTDEFESLTRQGAESADRRRFEWRGITGSMILVTTTTWRAHHHPERCFEVYGLSLDGSRTYLIAPNFSVRFISLGHGDNRSLQSAVYWFQSVDRVTADYGARIWADLPFNHQRWVMVTILFDGMNDPRDPDIQALCVALYDAVARDLPKGG